MASLSSSTCNQWSVQPMAGFCVKYKDVAGGKLFVNVCVCDQLPQPNQMLNETELAVLLDDESRANQFLIPMSISDVHDAVDHTGAACRKLDALINATFFETYVVTVCSALIDEKYALGLMPALRDNRFVILKNKRSVGDLRPQTISKQPASKPKIIELQDSAPSSSSNVPSSAKKPKSAVTQPKSQTPTTKPMPVGDVVERHKTQASQPQPISTALHNMNITPSIRPQPISAALHNMNITPSCRQPQYKIMSKVRDDNVKLRVLEIELYLQLVDDLKEIDIRVQPTKQILSVRCEQVYALDLHLSEKITDKGMRAEWDVESHVLIVILNVID